MKKLLVITMLIPAAGLQAFSTNVTTTDVNVRGTQNASNTSNVGSGAQGQVAAQISNALNQAQDITTRTDVTSSSSASLSIDPSSFMGGAGMFSSGLGSAFGGPAKALDAPILDTPIIGAHRTPAIVKEPLAKSGGWVSATPTKK